MPLAQVAEEATLGAFYTAPILIHPEHLSPSLPIGERRMGGVRGRLISSQNRHLEPSSPNLELHACQASLHMPRVGLGLFPLATPSPISELFASCTKEGKEYIELKQPCASEPVVCAGCCMDEAHASLKKKKIEEKQLCGNQAQLK